jgi:Serine aminopeptidase, S33
MAADPLVFHEVGPARTAAALTAALARIWPRVGELDTPLLGLHGTADELTSPRGTAELIRRARTPDRTLLLYKGLYHDLVHEPERDQVMGDIERWLERRVARALSVGRRRPSQGRSAGGVARRSPIGRRAALRGRAQSGRPAAGVIRVAGRSRSVGGQRPRGRRYLGGPAGQAANERSFREVPTLASREAVLPALDGRRDRRPRVAETGRLNVHSVSQALAPSPSRNYAIRDSVWTELARASTTLPPPRLARVRARAASPGLGNERSFQSPALPPTSRRTTTSPRAAPAYQGLSSPSRVSIL